MGHYGYAYTAKAITDANIGIGGGGGGFDETGGGWPETWPEPPPIGDTEPPIPPGFDEEMPGTGVYAVVVTLDDDPVSTVTGANLALAFTLDGAPSTDWRSFEFKLTFSHEVKAAGSAIWSTTWWVFISATSGASKSYDFDLDVTAANNGETLTVAVEIVDGVVTSGSDTADILETAEIVVALPASVEVDEAFDLTLTAKKSDGTTDTTYDGTPTTLSVAGYDGEAWVSFSSLKMSDGTAIDPAANWVDGVWTGSVKITSEEEREQLRVTANRDGEAAGSDTAEIYNEETTYQGLVDAIYKRQVAVSITGTWDAGNPTEVDRLICTDWNIYEYEIADLIAYVNEVAPEYLDGTYTGGAAVPDMLASTYANGTANISALATLVDAMATTFCNLSTDSERGTNDLGASSSDVSLGEYDEENDCYPVLHEATWGSAYANLDTAMYAISPSFYGCYGRWYECNFVGCLSETCGGEAALWGVHHAAGQAKFTLNGAVSAGITKTARLFVKPIDHSTGEGKSYGTFGESLPAKDTFGSVQETAMGSNTNIVFDWIGHDAMSSGQISGIATYQDFGIQSYSYTQGFKLDGQRFALLDWDF